MKTKGKVLPQPKGGSAFPEGSSDLRITTKVFVLPSFSSSGFSLKHTLLWRGKKFQNKSWNLWTQKNLGWCFCSNLCLYTCHLGDLTIMQILIQKIWGLLFCISTIHFISTSSQVMVVTSDSQTTLRVAKI